MTLFCYTCKRSFEIGEKEILYDNGSDMAVFQCHTCGIKYLAVADERFPNPILFKLTTTKSTMIEKERSRIIDPTQGRLIITPAEAARRK